MSDAIKILRVDASARNTGSITRQLADQFLEQMALKQDVSVARRDLANGISLINEDWVGANFTPAEARSDLQKSVLSLSDTLVSEVKDADLLLLAVPIYNFSVPAAFKAWIDQVCRAGVTFKYTEKGPVGLLEGKRAIVVLASGGTPSGADFDYATPYIHHVLGFIGISDVTVIAADALGQNADEKIAAANTQIGEILAA